MNSEEVKVRVKLGVTNLQMGGKGSMRRKKIPNSRKTRGVDIENESRELLDSIQNINVLMKDIKTDNKSLYDTYINIFNKEFCGTITKQYKKTNKCENHNIIRDKLKLLLSADGRETLCDDLSKYLLNNFNTLAIKEILKLFKLHNDVLKFGDYLTFTIIKIPPNDVR